MKISVQITASFTPYINFYHILGARTKRIPKERRKCIYIYAAAAVFPILTQQNWINVHSNIIIARLLFRSVFGRRIQNCWVTSLLSIFSPSLKRCLRNVLPVRYCFFSFFFSLQFFYHFIHSFNKLLPLRIDCTYFTPRCLIFFLCNWNRNYKTID